MYREVTMTKGWEVLRLRGAGLPKLTRAQAEPAREICG
jgi:hypothetical protein